ncbi:hypothetical protein D3H65_20135 [Paraflavitalea soli]|uniref:M56 family peptidase n=1 Tax=Paraflavitalea soli TaxID=2315862 RepID=A0A3B7MT62_9BACT|nr:M56 family metallopeptidase [Paraflavitalea soli]AXY76156.1 hypothetical protein D3H65_20135 [Paraflavitalea soli]
MPYIAQYLLKLSISLSVVYLFYALVLRRLTFYTCNRWYLLGYSFLAFFIPFVNISPMLDRGAWKDYKVVQLIPVVGNYEAAASASPLNAWTVSLLLLISGIVVMLVRLLMQYLSFRRIRRSSQLLSDNAVKIYQVDKFIIPFSFGRSIFINQHQHNEDELKEIIRHEFIHVKQRHTADILWSELVCMLNWYNPFAWLIRRAIRQNLEFIADHQVLEAGLDRKQYQYLLLKVVGVPAFAIANQFNFSSLKKRITMMNKMRSAKVHLIKFLFVLPLVTILLLAFRSAAIDHAAATVMDKEMAGAGNIEDIGVLTMPLHDTVPLKGKVTGGRVDSDSVPVIRIVQTQDSTRVMIDASLHGPGRPYKLLDGPVTQLQDAVLFIVDGVEMPRGEGVLQKIDPQDIESVSVLKDQSAETLYGERGKNGVIIITTKKAPKKPVQPELPPVKLVPDTVPGRPTTMRIRINDNVIAQKEGLGSFPGLIVLDGTIYDSLSIRKIDLKPEDIKMIEVLKDQSAEALYGTRGKNGVIRITTKNKDERITVTPVPDRRTAYAAAKTRGLLTQPPAQVAGQPFIIDARLDLEEPD